MQDKEKKVIEYLLQQRTLETREEILCYEEGVTDHCQGDKIDQRETPLNCRRTAVIEEEEWTTAQLRKDQEEDVDIGPLLKWKEDGVERPASKRYGLSGTPCVSRTHYLSELGKVRMGNIPPCN